MTARAGLGPLLGGVAAFLAGCSGGAGGLDAASRGAVEATVRRYVTASNQGDAAALTALYDEQAILLPPDHEPVRGREAIAEFWEEGTDTGLELTTLRLEGGGDAAYLIGRYRLPPTEVEEADSGQYVFCLQRQRDGSWKLTADIWNGSGASDERGAGGDPKAPLISSRPAAP